MKRIALTLAATILSTTAAVAATDIASFDANGDGFASVSEVNAVFPGFARTDFRQIDENRDNRISAAELQKPGVREVVARYEGGAASVIGLGQIDTDADGFASHRELAAVYPGLTDVEFDRIDANDDNRVSFRELYSPDAQVVVSLHEAAGSQVSVLAAVDANGDSFAGYGELQAAYPGLSVVDFRAIDANKDNRLSRVEFQSLDTQTVLRRSGS